MSRRTACSKLSALLVAAALSSAGPRCALADSVPLPVSGTIINQSGASGNCASTSGAQCAENYQFAAGGVGSFTPVLASAAGYSYTIQDSFNQTIGAAVLTQSDFGSSAYSASGCPSNPNCTNATPFLKWNFQDNF